jgi:hypothetical protein
VALQSKEELPTIDGPKTFARLAAGILQSGDSATLSEREREKRNELSSFFFKAKCEKSLHLIKHIPQECILNGSSSLLVSVILPLWEELQIPDEWEAGWALELFGQYEENNQLSMLGIKPQCL